MTADTAAPGAAPPSARHTAVLVRAWSDRPFGFLAVHRSSGLAVTAGWVTDPTPYPERGAVRP
nr:hypothetical protein StreXyl84_23140 [Streptomyces sp. Xyl84]